MAEVELTKEQFETIIGNAVANSIDKFKKDTGMDNVDWKHLMHPAEDENKLKEMNGRERLKSLLKAVATKDFGSLKTADPMVEGTDTYGGYLVPAVTRAEILRLLPTFGQARQLFRTIPMGKTDTMTIPSKNAGVTFASVAENASITSSKPTLSYIQLLAQKFGGIVVLANELLADANVDIQNYIISLFAEAIGTAEDQQMFAGTGSPFTGVFATTHTYGNEEAAATLSAISYTNLVDVVYGVDQKYLSGAKWLMHRMTFSEIRKLTDDEGRPLVTDPYAGSPATLFGFPVTLVENAPYTGAGQAVALLGNFNNTIIGDKGTISISLSNDATVDSTSLFQYDLSAIKITERIGFSAGLVTAYSAITINA